MGASLEGLDIDKRWEKANPNFILLPKNAIQGCLLLLVSMESLDQCE